MKRVLLIDDEPVVRALMVEILEEAGHEVVAAESAERALGHLHDPTLDLVVSDVVMPGLSGIELLDAVLARRPSLPVVLVTGSGTHVLLTEALAAGAAGIVLKPFAHQELRQACARALERVERREREVLERLLTPTLAGALANAIEAREASMHGHCERLCALAVRLADELGLRRGQIEGIRLGAILHDVGKIGIPDRVLAKPGLLTEEERALMRTHPLIGDHILESVDAFDEVRTVVRHHHERWDGAGYPDGLAADAIPLAARIVALADSIEAMSGARPYRRTLDREAIVHELERGRATQWDPDLVDLALELLERGEIEFAADGLFVSGPTTGAERRREAHAVLLVDDDPGYSELTRTTLEREVEGVRVVSAGDLASARDLCRAGAWSLVVVDHALPDGSGMELVDRLRETSPHVPVVVVTGADGIAGEAFRRGASDFVAKANGDLTELTSRVRALLEAAA